MPPTSEAQKARNKKHNEKVKNDPALRAKKNEYMRTWRKEHHEQELRRERENYYQAKEKAEAELIDSPNESYSCYDSEPSTRAAAINQTVGFSYVFGEYHKAATHVIGEKIRSDFGVPVFRVKVTTYQTFDSQKEACIWCRENGMKLSKSRWQKDIDDDIEKSEDST